ncbi:alpha/beta hydrolase [Herbiconiux moechotypicola]|uniref:Alpha/beta hydrolase n=1 Tax=Herbiconiux moechotypicola TaxID=637393 RepID=A0ABN3DZT1_9MICO|nr:alpha/beta hydrolase [Herbiconiux moechotypicola]MCS5731132.1 alpha/beta hydrolase [Herbiconiux moechotypicola]
MSDTTLLGRRFLLLDGWQHRREPLHWQGWLAERLVERGAEVDYLTLPDPENPRFADWSAVVGRALVRDGGPKGLTVIAHGLSVLLWLRMCGEATSPLAERVVLVAPPASGLHGGDVSAPLGAEVTPDAVAAAALRPTLLVWSADDPYLSEGSGGADALYGVPLGLESVEVPGGAHLNAASGFGPWPEMLEWCVTGGWPAARSLDGDLARLYAPAGHRLGIVVAGDLPASVLASVDTSLEAKGLAPERRRARLQPRVGEERLRDTDVAEFGTLYGHEYSVAVLATTLTENQDGRSRVESAYVAAGCPVIWV